MTAKVTAKDMVSYGIIEPEIKVEQGEVMLEFLVAYGFVKQANGPFVNLAAEAVQQGTSGMATALVGLPPPAARRLAYDLLKAAEDADAEREGTCVQCGRPQDNHREEDESEEEGTHAAYVPSPPSDARHGRVGVA